MAEDPITAARISVTHDGSPGGMVAWLEDREGARHVILRLADDQTAQHFWWLVWSAAAWHALPVDDQLPEGHRGKATR